MAPSSPGFLRRMSNPLESYRRLQGRFDPFDGATALLIAGMIVLVLVTFRDYAVSNDEEVQRHYGELIVAYYTNTARFRRH